MSSLVWVVSSTSSDKHVWRNNLVIGTVTPDILTWSIVRLLSVHHSCFFVSDISHRNAIVSNCISLVTRCICAVRVDCWPTGLSCTKCFRPRTHVLVFKNMSWSSRTCSYLTGSGYQWRRQGERGKLPPYGWTSKNYVICVCFRCHGTSSYHTSHTLQGRRAKSHVDTQAIQPGLGDFVL